MKERRKEILIRNWATEVVKHILKNKKKKKYKGKERRRDRK